MPEPITIGTSKIPNLLFNRLNNELQHLQRVEGLPLEVDIDRIGDFTFMDCQVVGAENSTEGVFETTKFFIANCIAEIIVDEWESGIISKIVRDNYFYYNEDERQTILNKAKELLNPLQYDSFQQKERKERIMLRILEYLDVHKEIILEGFINFRLKDYQDELEEIVNSAVDEFLLEKEFAEFIRLLRYFVDIQEPRVDKIMIVFKTTGKFELLDDKGNPLEHECLDGLMVNLLENEINYDDLLISTLITLAPREVELHLEMEVEVNDTIKTIQSVFGKRVSRCTGCEKCRPHLQN